MAWRRGYKAKINTTTTTSNKCIYQKFPELLALMTDLNLDLIVPKRGRGQNFRMIAWFIYKTCNTHCETMGPSPTGTSRTGHPLLWDHVTKITEQSDKMVGKKNYTHILHPLFMGVSYVSYKWFDFVTCYMYIYIYSFSLSTQCW